MKELRTFLKTQLPDYMVPWAFVTLAALPLTPNGKVDRRALPLPEQTRAASAEAFVAPRTNVEARVAQIWGQVLGLDAVGIHDSFFDLGGHSLLATQVISMVPRPGRGAGVRCSRWSCGLWPSAGDRRRSGRARRAHCPQVSRRATSSRFSSGCGSDA